MSGMSAAERSRPYPPPPPPPMVNNGRYMEFAYFMNGVQFGIRLYEEGTISFFNRNGAWSDKHGRWVCDCRTGQIFMVFQHSARHHFHACAVRIDWFGEMEFTGWDYLLRRIKMVPVYGRMPDDSVVTDKREICRLTLQGLNRLMMLDF